MYKSNRELDAKKKHGYMIRFTDAERKLLGVKSEQYGYKYVSEYIRDAAIYENIVIVNVTCKDELQDTFDTYINETKKLTKELRRILKYDTSMTDEEKNKVQNSLYRVYAQVKSLKKSINDNLNITEIKKQSRERLYKKQLEKLNKEVDAFLENE